MNLALGDIGRQCIPVIRGVHPELGGHQAAPEESCLSPRPNIRVSEFANMREKWASW